MAEKKQERRVLKVKVKQPIPKEEVVRRLAEKGLRM